MTVIAEVCTRKKEAAQPPLILLLINCRSYVVSPNGETERYH